MVENSNPYKAPEHTTRNRRSLAPLWRRVLSTILLVFATIPAFYFVHGVVVLITGPVAFPPQIVAVILSLAVLSGLAAWAGFRIRR